jgi:hypothetical protein
VVAIVRDVATFDVGSVPHGHDGNLAPCDASLSSINRKVVASLIASPMFPGLPAVRQ